MMSLLFGAAVLVMMAVVSGSQLQSFDTDQRIYQGTRAKQGEFPYIARITKIAKSGDKSSCTGSIISSRWILTAAHCGYGAKAGKVFLGRTTNNINNRTMHVLKYEIPMSNIFVIDSYNTTYKYNDIALFKLPVSAPVNTKEFPAIKTIALPPRDPVSKYDNENVTAVGYGQVNDGVESDTLRWSFVNVMNHDQCESAFERKSHNGQVITDSMICTDKDIFHSGACKGDSGGPLVYEGSNGEPTVIAAASFIVGNCSSNTPVIYTYVPEYLDWIYKTTGIQVG